MMLSTFSSADRGIAPSGSLTSSPTGPFSPAETVTGNLAEAAAGQRIRKRWEVFTTRDGAVRSNQVVEFEACRRIAMATGRARSGRSPTICGGGSSRRSTNDRSHLTDANALTSRLTATATWEAVAVGSGHPLTNDDRTDR